MEVEFRNITITISDVADAEEAYDKLCDLFANGANAIGVKVEWTTDSYCVDSDPTEHDTSGLFPRAT